MQIINWTTGKTAHMDKNEVIINVKQYSELINQVIEHKKVILFGSYAKGNAKELSDIDVAVFVDEIPDEYLNISKKLFKIAGTVDNRIEPIIVSEKNNQSGFVTDILKHGIVII